MIRYLIHRPTTDGKVYAVIAGLSTDAKPTAGLITGSRFVEADTGAGYLFNETGSAWAKSQQLTETVAAYLDEHPEALDQAAIEAMFGDQLDAIEAEQGVLKSAVEDLEAGSLSALGATAGQVPTADGDGSWEWDTPSGGGGDVTDVQVNGASVVTDGVANVPIANNETPGVMKYALGYGLVLDANNILKINAAGASVVKVGSSSYAPITPARQHDATFYGLAKAAGDTTQSVSSNAVGTYTDAAKSAIQTMLGISGIIAPVEDATASKPYAIGDAFLHGGALYKASAAIAAGDAIVPGTNCTQTTIIEMLKGA